MCPSHRDEYSRKSLQPQISDQTFTSEPHLQAFAIAAIFVKRLNLCLKRIHLITFKMPNKYKSIKTSFVRLILIKAEFSKSFYCFYMIKWHQ